MRKQPIGEHATKVLKPPPPPAPPRPRGIVEAVAIVGSHPLPTGTVSQTLDGIPLRFDNAPADGRTIIVLRWTRLDIPGCSPQIRITDWEYVD